MGDLPDALGKYGLEAIEEGTRLRYVYDTKADRTGITALLNDLQLAGLQMVDMETRQSSLEEIFVGLVKGDAA
jgi:ABC-2 type transport system ATP-binding protein